MWISKINKERSRKNSEQQAAEEKAERHARLKKS
jgi:hypothetical protein